jgi:tetratricopeptide (TPR) repeat protein
MATKQKQRPKQGAGGLLQQARRALEKGDFKQALKDAKVAYRQQPSPEVRPLLERAYLGRARQLHRAGLPSEAQAVVEGLLDLGSTDAEVQEALPELLVALGLFNRLAKINGGTAVLEEGNPLYSRAADHAVLLPEKAPASLPAVRRGAEAIRQALAAIEADDEAAAMTAMKDIPRTSPFADWKYFVRGLAAYYRQEPVEMAANWDRLEAGRFAARIAASLKVLADPSVVPLDDFRSSDTLARLGSKVLGGPIMAQLLKLQAHIAARRYHDAVKVLRGANPLLKQLDPALPQRLTRLLYASIAHDGDPKSLRELAAVDALPVDPHWNCGLAMAWENYCGDADPYDDEYQEDIDHIDRHWRAYEQDLIGIECLSPAERQLARGMVWNRLGHNWARELNTACSCGSRHGPDENSQRRTIESFEQALSLAPELLDAYQGLADAYSDGGDREEAVATQRRLLERFPEHLPTLLALISYHLRRDQPLAAREFSLRAQRLKPLDPKIKKLVWLVHAAAARRHALAHRWDEGRAEFAAAEKIDGSAIDAAHLLCGRAALEFKAGDAELAHRFLDQALGGLDQAAVLLLMAIAGRRYALPHATAEEFTQRWSSSLKKSRQAPSLGFMSQILCDHLEREIDYPGRTEHVTALVALLRRSRRIRNWHPGSLRHVIQFLVTASEKEGKPIGGDDHLEMMRDLANKGRRKFPEFAIFPLMCGGLELRKNPAERDFTFVRECFGRVLAMEGKARDVDSAELLQIARRQLDALNNPWNAFHGPMPTRTSPSFVSDEDDEDDEEDFRPDFRGTSLPRHIIEKLVRLAREAGLDPCEVMKGIAGGDPFFGDFGKASSKKKKGK